MGDAASVATVLKNTKSSRDEASGIRDAQILARIWADFWELWSFGSHNRAPLREAHRLASIPPNRALPDHADARQGGSSSQAFQVDGDFLPAAGGQKCLTPDAGSSNGGPQPRELHDVCPRGEPRVHDPAVSLPKAAGDDTESSAFTGKNDQPAYQDLLSGLRERYRGILSRRTNYVNLMSFVFFTAFYAVILFYQRRAFLSCDIHKSLTYLLPADDKGDVVSEFRSIMGVHDWLETLVNDTWINPICGNGMCEMPVEVAAYGRFGCQEDCGWRQDLLQVTIDLSYMFVTENARTSSFWNICRKGTCSHSSLDPAMSAEPSQQSCYFPHANGFAHLEGNISAAVYLPISTEWEFCLVTTSWALPVAGTVSQVFLPKAERTRRRSERDGFLGEGPVETNVDDLYSTVPGTIYASPPPALPPLGFTPLDYPPPFSAPPDGYVLVLGSSTLGGSPTLGSSPLSFSSVGPPAAVGHPTVATAEPASSPGLSSDGPGTVAPLETVNARADGPMMGAMFDASGASGKDSTYDATAAKDATLQAASVGSDPTNQAGAAASAQVAGGPGALRLLEWPYASELSPCQLDCLHVAACVGRCQGTPRQVAEASTNMTLPQFDTAALARVCGVLRGCDVQPQSRLPDVGVVYCTSLDIMVPLLQAYLLQGDVAGLIGLLFQCNFNFWMQSGPMMEETTCAPGCLTSGLGDFLCDPACFVDECQYDYGDCCEEHHHHNGDHHFHCPPANGSRPKVAGGQLFRFGFTVPPHMDVDPADVDRAAGGSANPLLIMTDGNSTSEELQWRMAGVTNRIVAGLVIKQRRTPLQPAPRDKKFYSLFDVQFDKAGNAKAFGANPRFLSQSSMYVPALVNRTHEYFTPDQLSDQDVPLAFFPISHRGKDIFPIFIDMSLSQEDALMWLRYLKEGTFLDVATESVEVQIVTYNGILEYFGMLIASCRRQPGGVVSITSTIQMFSLDMYNTPAERLRGVGEVLLVLMVIAGTLFELQQVLFTINTHNAYHYFANVANLIDLTSISLFYVCIALWVRFLINYHSDFNIQLSYQPYRTDFSSEEEGLAKMLELANNGDGMRELLDTFEEVQNISRTVNVYSLLTALNLVLMMLRVLKLTDFQPRLGIVTHTLARAMNDIAHYLPVAGVVFVSFATMAHLSFGTSVAEFSTLSDSFNTCFLMVMGQVNINDKLIEMQGLQLTMAWIFFWLFMIFMCFILINFFIAFILDSFSDHMRSGARSSSTVARDVRDIFRDAARQAWALLTCQGGHARSDASVVAKLEALIALSKKAKSAGAQPAEGDKETGGGGGGADGARPIEGAGKALDTSGGYASFMFDIHEGAVDGNASSYGHGSSKAHTDINDNSSTREDGLTLIVGSQQASPGISATPNPTRNHDQKPAPSRLISLLSPSGWRARLQAQKRQQPPETRHVSIDGCTFNEDEIAKLLLKGLQAATLASKPGGKGNDGLWEGGGDRLARSLRAKAHKALFSLGPAGVSVRGAVSEAASQTSKDGSRGDAEVKVQWRGLGPYGKKLRGSHVVEVEEDVESSPRETRGEVSVPAPVTSPAMGVVSTATCRDVAHEISSHAIWRFGTTAADEVALGPTAPGEPSMPDDPTVQIAHMVGGLRAQLVEMEARWAALFPHRGGLTQALGVGRPQQQQQQLAGLFSVGGIAQGAAPGGAQLHGGSGGAPRALPHDAAMSSQIHEGEAASSSRLT